MRSGWRLRYWHLFESPTVGELAQVIEKADGTSSTHIMVCIQPEGRGTPFFCSHPVGGNALCYADLARGMGNDLQLCFAVPCARPA